MGWVWLYYTPHEVVCVGYGYITHLRRWCGWGVVILHTSGGGVGGLWLYYTPQKVVWVGCGYITYLMRCCGLGVVILHTS